MKIENILTDAEITADEAQELLNIVSIAAEATKEDAEKLEKHKQHVEAATQAAKGLIALMRLNNPANADKMQEELDSILKDEAKASEINKKLEIRQALKTKLTNLLK